MSKASNTMMWVVRGTTSAGQDFSAVFEAGTAAEAQYMALRRNLPPVITVEARQGDIELARECGLFFATSHRGRPTCFGQPLKRWQIAALLFAGIGTIALHLKVQPILELVRQIL